jgi:hypothetical protein
MILNLYLNNDMEYSVYKTILYLYCIPISNQCFYVFLTNVILISKFLICTIGLLPVLLIWINYHNFYNYLCSENRCAKHNTIKWVDHNLKPDKTYTLKTMLYGRWENDNHSERCVCACLCACGCALIIYYYIVRVCMCYNVCGHM